MGEHSQIERFLQARKPGVGLQNKEISLVTLFLEEL